MGAWGLGNFENDSTIDWLNDFMVNPKLSALEEPVNLVLQEDEFIDSEESFATLAAAEILATLNGFPPKDLPADIDFSAVKFSVPDDAISKAIQAIYKILYFDQHSELRELWQETEEFEEWASVQADLVKRLKASLSDNRN